MRCPRCFQTMHLSAEECPHCGLTLDELDVVYKGFGRVVRRPHDVAGVLRLTERQRVAKWISKAERAFPQLYFSVATVALKGDQQIRSYGYWLMNRGTFEDTPEESRADGCVLIVIDVNRKEVCLHLGYLLDQYVMEIEAFESLTAAHPHLLESNFVPAVEVLLKGVRKYVKRLSRRARQEAKRIK